MPLSNVPGLVAGAVALGAIHGAEPGHGWPIAASYAFERANRWISGALAGLIIGTGHLISSIAVVGVFFLVKSQLALENLNQPLSVAGVPIGSPIGVFAGVLLILLGIREYRSDGHSHDHDHSHDDHRHSHDDHSHSHDDHGRLADATDEGLSAIAFSAFVLGFAHEEEFEIIAICAGSDYCLSLMLIYALTVVAVITALTLLLVAGYERFEERMERLSEYFPTISAVVLIVMGVGFLLGVF
jgi:ABC-type nickel/cobalt efflux system permease component RcnA